MEPLIIVNKGVAEKHHFSGNVWCHYFGIADSGFISYRPATPHPANCAVQIAAATGKFADSMRGKRFRFTWFLRRVAGAAAALIFAAFLTIEFAAPAQALPSYARQTGQPCGSCHTDFAGLTPYGRRFKIGGYTYGGGPYRTSPFSSDDSTNNSQKTWVPPISAMVTLGLTHTEAPMAPPTDPFKTNDNITVAPLSVFWGGAITDHIGAFAQLTYGGPPMTASIGNDPYVHSWGWDNTDVRFADSTSIGNVSITYGITANNNPTVQDPWNTTPAWQFPYALTPFTAGFGPTPIIDSALGPGHVGSVGAYAYVADMLYLEASVYRTLSPNVQNDLGEDPFDAPGLFDAAPYWRAAFEPHWGNNWIEIGTFGMAANVHPFTSGPSPPFTPPPLPPVTTATSPLTDRYTDIGLDSQYQYQGDNFWFTLRGSYIREYQDLNASFANGFIGNPFNELNEARAYASLAYGNDNRIVLTGQYFTATGSPALSADTNGWIAEIAYIPFISSFAPGWPWLNARIGLQYTWYEKLNGTTIGASSNNALFLYLWLAM